MSKITPLGVGWPIRILAFLLAILFITLFGFVLGDIDDMPSPQMESFLEVSPELKERHSELQLRVKSAEFSVAREREIQKNLQASLGNAQRTMDQMIDLVTKMLVYKPEKRWTCEHLLRHCRIIGIINT